MISLSKDLMDQIRSHGRETDPEECVGALLGRKGEPAQVVSVERIDNIRTAERARRYEISPQDYLRVEGLAAEKSLALLGSEDLQLGPGRNLPVTLRVPHLALTSREHFPCTSPSPTFRPLSRLSRAFSF